LINLKKFGISAVHLINITGRTMILSPDVKASPGGLPLIQEELKIHMRGFCNSILTLPFITPFLSVGPETSDLLDRLLILNPKERITASQALEHDYFWTDPMPADPKTSVL
jgi:serine/threonine protein kinase